MATITLIRHGETAWSAAGKHTGRTDIPLTAAGEERARHLAEILGGEQFALVLTSPLQRASRTAQLAGLTTAQTDDNLVEWDYGKYEGRTTDDISTELGRDWRVFRDGVVDGEPLAHVAERARAVLARVQPYLTRGDDVALVGHGHQLRILTTQWLGIAPENGAMFPLSAGSVSRLGAEHGIHGIVLWNAAPPLR